MKLFIPTIGTKLRLTADWTFILHNERRNSVLVEALAEQSFVRTAAHRMTRERYEEAKADPDYRNLRIESECTLAAYEVPKGLLYRQGGYVEKPGYEVTWEVARWAEETPVTLPAETIVSVDRIYIRKGLDDFDSVTFNITDSPDRCLLPRSKKGALKGQPRFWAKLADVNTMDVEIV